MRRHGWVLAGLASTLAGCPFPDDSLPPDLLTPPRPVNTAFLDPRIEAAPPVSLADAPPPISGGTLHVLSSGAIAVVADPDRDRILTVDLVARAVLGTATLPADAEPTRIAEDAVGRVHVVLRGAGAVFSFDPEHVEDGASRAVCTNPRGIAYDADSDALLVACLGGELASLPAGGGTVTSTRKLDRDLRDVVVRRSRLFVSRFRSAELLELDREGRLLERHLPATTDRFGDVLVNTRDTVGLDVGNAPSVAWRAVPVSAPLGSRDGDSVLMVHQRASEAEVQPAPGGYGATTADCDSSIVQSTLTFFGADGRVRGGAILSGATLPVDVAVSPPLASDASRQWVTVIAAGNESGANAVLSYARSSVESPGSFRCLGPELAAPTVQNATSAAYAPNGTLAVLARDPAVLVLFRPDRNTATLVETGRVDLGGAPRYDTGHAVFHANSGAFLACASCHPEGGDDGRVWSFGRIGPRRTPAMNGHLLGTEPFHWDGDMNDLGHLMDEVFSGRMSGPRLTPPQVDALGGWLDVLSPPTPAAESEQSARGQALFFGEAQCSSCHLGGVSTNSFTVDVGTGGRFQVPSLAGIAHRLPAMHDGCAATLRDRFDPDCGGGDAHGRTSQLDGSEVADLVSYLETL